MAKKRKPKGTQIRVFAPDDDWITAFESRANELGKSVSGWLCDLGYKDLSKKVQAGLSPKRGVGRPKKESAE